MDTLNATELARGSLLLVDTAPIIYVLEGHPRFAEQFELMFQRYVDGELFLAVSTNTIAEVLTGPIRAREETLARRYRAALEAWQVVELTSDITESAARFRGQYGLKLPDAIQLASAVAISADALVTHARDFYSVQSLKILT